MAPAPTMTVGTMFSRNNAAAALGLSVFNPATMSTQKKTIAPMKANAASRWSASSQSSNVIWPVRLEQLLELHGRAHVALDLQLPGHVRRGGVLLAAGDLGERLGGRRQSAVAALISFCHAHLTVRDLHRPRA